MNMELFYKKVYTVAFRLTGEEGIACEMSISAITNIIKGIDENKGITENSFMLTVLELIKIFLNTPCVNYDDNLNEIQRALLKLKPMSRAVIIWNDVLGYNVSDNMPLNNYSHKEHLMILKNGRRELRDCINADSAAKTPKIQCTDSKYRKVVSNG